jgi:hypothetical protein
VEGHLEYHLYDDILYITDTYPRFSLARPWRSRAALASARILHFYGLSEFAQYHVFSSEFALSAFVLAAVFLRSNLPPYLPFFSA